MKVSPLELGGMSLIRAPGGVDIRCNHGPTIRLQNADLQEIVEWLAKCGFKKRWFA